MGSFDVKKSWSGESVLSIDIAPFHPQVLPFFPHYDPDRPAPETILDYSDPRNSVGHQQRAFLCYWALRSFVELGVIGIDLGSAGVVTPMCISLDVVGNGETPEYGGVMQGVHVKGDAADLSIFGNDSFSCVVSNHMIEHIRCSHLRGGEFLSEKYQLGCKGGELIGVFIDQWLRVLRPGGYFCAIFPEEEAARRGGSGVFHQDRQHQHAWFAKDFYDAIVVPLIGRGTVQLERFNTLKNGFSCDVVLRKN